MTRRPTLGVLAGIVALCFVAAFAAAAALKPQAAPAPAAQTAAVAAPAAASEDVQVAQIGRAAMSQEAALPGLRLPVRRHHPRRHVAPPVRHVVVAAAPVPTARPVVPAATPRPVIPVPTARPVTPAPAPAHTAPSTPNVGMTFDSSG